MLAVVKNEKSYFKQKHFFFLTFLFVYACFLHQLTQQEEVRFSSATKKEFCQKRLLHCNSERLYYFFSFVATLLKFC